MSCLLTSDFPRLEKAYLDLEIDASEEMYSLPEAFVSGKNCPQITRLEYSGALEAGEEERLKISPLSKRQGMTLLVEDTR